jgi:hypothetical protein
VQNSPCGGSRLAPIFLNGLWWRAEVAVGFEIIMKRYCLETFNFGEKSRISSWISFTAAVLPN